MKRSADEIELVAGAAVRRPQGQVLKGQYVGAYRSDKGKIKGLILQVAEQEYTIKLPKYLRPMLVRELMPQAFVQVWAYPDEGIWRAINVMPLPEAEAIALKTDWGIQDNPLTVAPAPSRCIQVCRKGKCFKQGGQQIFQALQAEVETNPEWQGVSIEAVGCLKECKRGPNVKVLPTGKIISRLTPTSALEILSQCK